MLSVVPSPSKHSIRVLAAARLRSHLAALEAALDQSIAAAAALAQAIVEARRDSGVPVHTGQSALMRLQRVQDRLVDASSDTFRVHDEAAQIGKTLMVLEDPTNQSGLLAPDEVSLVAA